MIVKSIVSLVLALSIWGCSYHYHLHVVIDPGASQPASDGESEPSAQVPSQSKPNMMTPQAQSGPMAIEPGQFTVSQSKGGNMINVVLNVNSSKPTEVTTDTSLSGIPGL